MKVNLVFSAPLAPGSEDGEDEEENGKGEMMATITEISIFKVVGSEERLNVRRRLRKEKKSVCDQNQVELPKIKCWANWRREPSENPSDRSIETQRSRV